MTTYAEFQNNLEKDAITQSVSPGLYHMNTIQKEGYSEATRRWG